MSKHHRAFKLNLARLAHIKLKLKGLSPIQYRNQALVAA
ncbi:IS3 family transposase [Alteromonas sp. Mac1]